MKTLFQFLHSIFFTVCFAFSAYAQDSISVIQTTEQTAVASTTEVQEETAPKDTIRNLIFTTKIYLEAIKDDTLSKYFFEQKVKNAISAAYLFPPADSANKSYQPRAEAVTHDEQPLEELIAKSRSDYSTWKDYRKKRDKWLKKQKKKEKKKNRKFARKFRKGKTEFNWNRLEEAEQEYEDQLKAEEEAKEQRKQEKKEAKRLKKEERKKRKEERKARKNKVEEPPKEEYDKFWLTDEQKAEEAAEEKANQEEGQKIEKKEPTDKKPKKKKGKEKKEEGKNNDNNNN